MKIIKEGRIPDPPRKAWPFNEYDILTCPRCETTFTISEEDTKPWADRDQKAFRDGDYSTEWTVIREKCLNGRQEATGKCPFCHERVTVSAPRITR